MQRTLISLAAAVSLLAACTSATVVPQGYTITSNVPQRACPPGNQDTAFPSSGKVRCEGDERFPGPSWTAEGAQ